MPHERGIDWGIRLYMAVCAPICHCVKGDIWPVFNLPQTIGIILANPFKALLHLFFRRIAQISLYAIKKIRQIQQDCRQADDEPRWLVALISDTGMRLSEAAGLHIDDIKLDEEVPHIDLKPHAWRSLKTRGSQRQIPLVGASLWAAQRIKNDPHHTFGFPRYNTTSTTNANSASAAINKWLKPRVPEGCVIHSFRHSLRDRLRAVQCPSDMIGQLGGWSTSGIGQAHGEGYGLSKSQEWLTLLSIRSC
jgi:integrase